MEVKQVTEEPAAQSTELELDETDIELLTEGAAQIMQYLGSDAQAEDRLLGMLDRRLSEGIDDATWSHLYKSLTTLVGPRGVTIIAWSATVDPSPIDTIEQHVPPEVTAFVRRIAATYGPELVSAYEHANESPDNWRYVNREVYQDLVRNQPHIRLRIEKYSGEETVIEGPGDSILSLARSIILALRLVGSRDEFSEPRIQEYLEEADQLEQLLRPEPDLPTTEPVTMDPPVAVEAGETS
jgi:hypothetical protein